MGHNTLRSVSGPLGTRGKADLLGVTAQQLRVPLTTLQLHLQLLARTAERAPSVSSDQLAQKLQLLSDQAWRMSEIIEGADDLARVLEGDLQRHLQPAPAELGQLVQTVLERLNEYAREQECEISFDEHSAVWGEWDAARVKRVLAALIQNAFAYAPHAEVQIVIETDGTRAVIELRDSGRGIADADLARLELTPLLPARTKSGAGLGLWLASQLAAAMGGELKGERLTGTNIHGSRFRLSLPLIASAGGAA